MKLKDKILDLWFPRRCAVCDEVVDGLGQEICSRCKGKMIYIKEPCCMKCGKQLKKEEQEYCADCSRTEHTYIQGTALYDYGSMSDSIFRFKYAGRMEYSAFYGRELYEKKLHWLRARRADALVPVPIHASRKRRRGYNQAELIARRLSELSGIPVEASLIRRVRKTRPLKGLSNSERQNNLKRAFKIDINDVKLNTIVIIDDIYTTGATIDSMAQVLKEKGVKKIYFMALAVGRGI
ncbi:MAG: ComF family protein [Lachnospiraceae bacterium]|nr:ComF family protein [Lachnospiraceae bacterium]